MYVAIMISSTNVVICKKASIKIWENFFTSSEQQIIYKSKKM